MRSILYDANKNEVVYRMRPDDARDLADLMDTKRSDVGWAADSDLLRKAFHDAAEHRGVR